MTKIKILITDDHSLFLEGVKSLLEDVQNFQVVATANSGGKALEFLKQNDVDVLITDINMPEMDGVELSKQVVKQYPQVKILALTMHDEQRIILNMLKQGVHSYILKNAAKEEFLMAINSIMQGERYVSDEVKDKLISTTSPNISKKTNMLKLSERETEILLLVAQELTTQQIADKLFISHHTVISHRKKLLYKFDVHNTAGLIKKAFDLGFIS